MALWNAVKEHSGEGVIWARSAWAGSQRYPLHWGGDAATNDIGMLGDLRGGLSFGLSGFSFWSHDMGGFVTASPASPLSTKPPTTPYGREATTTSAKWLEKTTAISRYAESEAPT